MNAESRKGWLVAWNLLQLSQILLRFKASLFSWGDKGFNYFSTDPKSFSWCKLFLLTGIQSSNSEIASFCNVSDRTVTMSFGKKSIYFPHEFSANLHFRHCLLTAEKSENVQKMKTTKSRKWKYKSSPKPNTKKWLWTDARYEKYKRCFTATPTTTLVPLVGWQAGTPMLSAPVVHVCFQYCSQE